MDKTIHNIILEKLCSALTAIVLDILKYCPGNSEAQQIITKNITNINNILETISKPIPNGNTQSAAAPQQPQTPVIEIVPRVTRQGLKTNAESTKVPVSQQKQTNTKKPLGKQKVTVPSVPVSINIEENNEGTSSAGDNLSELSTSDLEMELIALNPSRSVYVSGFPAATSTKAITNHIIKKLPMLDVRDMEVVKNPVKGDFASFVLKTDRNKTFFNSLMDKDIWPENTIVHKYDSNRKNNLFRAPKPRNFNRGKHNNNI